MSNSSPEPAQAVAPPVARKPILSDLSYAVLKHVAAVGLPALSTLYIAIAQIWNLGHSEQVAGSITAFNVFLGAFMVISQASYDNSSVKYDGNLLVSTDENGQKSLSLSVDTPDAMTALTTSKDATFRVVPVK